MTEPLPTVLHNNSERLRNQIVEQSRLHYAKPKSEVTQILEGLLPQYTVQEDEAPVVADKENLKKESNKAEEKIKKVARKDEENIKLDDRDNSKERVIQTLEKKRDISKHRLLQQELKKCGQSCGFLSVIEAQVEGGKVDVSLKREDVSLAIEVSVSNTPEYEVKNIEKCIKAKYDVVIVVSDDSRHLKNIEITYGNSNQTKVQFMSSQNAFDFIRNLKQNSNTEDTPKFGTVRLINNFTENEEKNCAAHHENQ